MDAPEAVKANARLQTIASLGGVGSLMVSLLDS